MTEGVAPLQSCIDAGGERCEPVIKAIDGRPTREHVLRLLASVDSSKELANLVPATAPVWDGKSVSSKEEYTAELEALALKQCEDPAAAPEPSAG